MNFLLFGLYAVLSVTSLFLLKNIRLSFDWDVLKVLVLGGLLYAASFSIWVLIVSRVTPSLSYPIAVGLTILGSVVIDWYLGGLTFGLVKILGSICVIIGIYLLSMS